MEMITYLAKVGELTLKGGNLREFERRLIQNTQLYLESIKSRVTLRAGRMYIDCEKTKAKSILKKTRIFFILVLHNDKICDNVKIEFIIGD